MSITVVASKAQLERIRIHGFCTNLPEALVKLGADVVLLESWPVNSNPVNAAELIVVDIEPTIGPEVLAGEGRKELGLVAPFSIAELEAVDAGLYSRHDGLYFPVVGGFAILIRSQAIIATQLLDEG